MSTLSLNSQSVKGYQTDRFEIVKQPLNNKLFNLYMCTYNLCVSYIQSHNKNDYKEKHFFVYATKKRQKYKN